MLSWMGSVWARFRSGRRGAIALACVLGLANGCGRSDLDPVECQEPEVEACQRADGRPGVRTCFDGMWSECGPGMLPVGGGGGSGGSGGGQSGAGGQPLGGAGGKAPIGGAGAGGAGAGGAGAGGLGGFAGMGPAGAAGMGGQAPESLYCDEGERAVLYLLTDDPVLMRVDADTLESLSVATLNVVGLNSLAVTSAGVVYASAGLDLYRINAQSGQATKMGLDTTDLVGGETSMTIGFSPADPVLFGDSLLLAHADQNGEIDLYAVPLDTFSPLWRHHFDDLFEYPEPVVAPDGRTFALLTEGFAEWDPGILVELSSLPVPGLPEAWSGDSAFLSGYLFAAYAETDTLSRVYRARVMPTLKNSPITEIATFPAAIIGAGAACEQRP